MQGLIFEGFFWVFRFAAKLQQIQEETQKFLPLESPLKKLQSDS